MARLLVVVILVVVLNAVTGSEEGAKDNYGDSKQDNDKDESKTKISGGLDVHGNAQLNKIGEKVDKSKDMNNGNKRGHSGNGEHSGGAKGNYAYYSPQGHGDNKKDNTKEESKTKISGGLDVHGNAQLNKIGEKVDKSKDMNNGNKRGHSGNGEHSGGAKGNYAYYSPQGHGDNKKDNTKEESKTKISGGLDVHGNAQLNKIVEKVDKSKDMNNGNKRGHSGNGEHSGGAKGNYAYYSLQGHGDNQQDNTKEESKTKISGGLDVHGNAQLNKIGEKVDKSKDMNNGNKRGHSGNGEHSGGAKGNYAYYSLQGHGDNQQDNTKEESKTKISGGLDVHGNAQLNKIGEKVDKSKDMNNGNKQGHSGNGEHSGGAKGNYAYYSPQGHGDNKNDNTKEESKTKISGGLDVHGNAQLNKIGEKVDKSKDMNNGNKRGHSGNGEHSGGTKGNYAYYSPQGHGDNKKDNTKEESKTKISGGLDVNGNAQLNKIGEKVDKSKDMNNGNKRGHSGNGEHSGGAKGNYAYYSAQGHGDNKKDNTKEESKTKISGGLDVHGNAQLNKIGEKVDKSKDMNNGNKQGHSGNGEHSGGAKGNYAYYSPQGHGDNKNDNTKEESKTKISGGLDVHGNAQLNKIGEKVDKSKDMNNGNKRGHSGNGEHSGGTKGNYAYYSPQGHGDNKKDNTKEESKTKISGGLDVHGNAQLNKIGEKVDKSKDMNNGNKRGHSGNGEHSGGAKGNYAYYSAQGHGDNKKDNTKEESKTKISGGLDVHGNAQLNKIGEKVDKSKDMNNGNKRGHSGNGEHSGGAKGNYAYYSRQGHGDNQQDNTKEESKTKISGGLDVHGNAQLNKIGEKVDKSKDMNNSNKQGHSGNGEHSGGAKGNYAYYSRQGHGDNQQDNTKEESKTKISGGLDVHGNAQLNKIGEKVDKSKDMNNGNKQGHSGNGEHSGGLKTIMVTPARAMVTAKETGSKRNPKQKSIVD